MLGFILLGWLVCTVLVGFINFYFLENFDDESLLPMLLLGPITLVIFIIFFSFEGLREFCIWLIKQEKQQKIKPKPTTILEEFNDFLDTNKTIEFEIKTKRKTRRRKNESHA